MTKMNNATASASATVNATIETKVKKLTKKECFGLLETIVKNSSAAEKDMLLEFISHEINLLTKKSTGKTSAVQKANVGISETILTVLKELNKPVTISELLEDKRLQTYQVEEKGETKTLKMSGQKLSALITYLKRAGLVERTVEKKKAYFTLCRE